MSKKIVYAVVAGVMLSTSLGANASSSLSHRGGVAAPESDSPFPKDNSTDYGIHVATPGTDSPFPKDNSNDHGVDHGSDIAA